MKKKKSCLWQNEFNKLKHGRHNNNLSQQDTVACVGSSLGLGVQKSPETVKTGRVRKVFFFQIPPEHNMN